MWVDMEKMEFMMENTSTKDDIEAKSLLNFECLFKDSESHKKKVIQDAIRKCKYNVGPKTLDQSVAEERAREVVIGFGKEKLSQDLTDCDTIL